VIEAGFLLGPCLALVVVTRHTHTHTADVCVCRGGYGTTLTHFLGLFLDDVVVVVVCPRNHGAFFLSSVRWYPKLFSGWMIIGNCFFLLFSVSLEGPAWFVPVCVAKRTTVQNEMAYAQQQLTTL
jgi:hypothetical protein